MLQEDERIIIIKGKIREIKRSMVIIEAEIEADQITHQSQSKMNKLREEFY